MSIEIDRRLCVGLFILGALSHYDKYEVIKFKSIQYIASTLHAKHFPIKNGTAKQRFNKDIKALSVLKVNWDIHSQISNKSWIKAADSFSKESAITVSALILAILRKEPKVAKWYGFNQKKLDKFSKSSQFKDMHIFSSSRVATKLLEHLDSEISYFYHS